MKKICIFFLVLTVLTIKPIKANLILANPSNYLSFLPTLIAGDTLLLAAGIYTNNLTLNNLNGSTLQPIVITGVGNTTIFQGKSCCNTVSITKCSYLVIENFKLDGLNQFVDGVKAEGTVGNWAHHITIEKLYIVNYFLDQQQVGISTKCYAWNWLIRKNIILGSGTGMYLGNSNGDSPFVNGIIENNFIANTIGYNIEIKQQNNGVRNSFTGTAVNGFTIIRNNVFTKDSITSSTGANARPNLLVGGYATVGWGSLDYYEIYGNFFYNNPVEALFQGTGNINLYENIFVNHYDPSGFRAVYITPQNGVSPQDVKIFHNTLWVANSSGGVRLYSPNANYNQYCYANAIFSTLPITNFSNSLNNITDTYSNVGNYVLSATRAINTLNLYPQKDRLVGLLTPSTLFQNYTWWDKDFNNNSYNWTFSGAYSGCCINNGWQLQLDTMPTVQTSITASQNLIDNHLDVIVYPNPASSFLFIGLNSSQTMQVRMISFLGKEILTDQIHDKECMINISDLTKGIYFVEIRDENKHKMIKKIVLK